MAACNRGGATFNVLFCIVGVQLVLLVTFCNLDSNSVQPGHHSHGGFLAASAPLDSTVSLVATSRTLKQRKARHLLEASNAAQTRQKLIQQKMSTLLALSEKAPLKLMELLDDTLEVQKSIIATKPIDKPEESLEAKTRRLDLLARALSLRAASQACQSESGPCWSQAQHAAAASVNEPDYPFEPLLDADYIFDSDNYLEDWMTKKYGPVGGKPPGSSPPPWPANGGSAPDWARVGYKVMDKVGGKYGTIVSDSPWKVKWDPEKTESLIWSWMSLKLVSAFEITTAKPSTSVATAAATEAPTTVATTTTEATTQATTTEDAAPLATPTPKVSNLFKSTCYTHKDLRMLDDLFQPSLAPAGTKCLFGVMDQDEGSHCFYDKGKYGSFGWCYTKEDKSEWGSCSEDCPLTGSYELLGTHIERLSARLKSIIKKLKLPCKNSFSVVKQ